MKFSSFLSLVQPAAVSHDIEFSVFITRLLTKRRFLGETMHPGWSPATFDPPQRLLVNVKEVTCLCLDYDGGETLEDTLPKYESYRGLYHTTRNHRVEKKGVVADRFRVVLLLSRPVTPEEYQKIWLAFTETAGEIDQAPKDPSRFWYSPGAKDEAHYEGGEFKGEPLPVEFWLKKVPKPPVQKVANDVRSRSYLKMADSPITRAREALMQMRLSVSGNEGDRDLYSAALRCAHFGLDEGQVLSLISEFNESCQPPWEERALVHKVKCAMDYFRAHPQEEPPKTEETPKPKLDLQNDPRFVTKRQSFGRALAMLTAPDRPPPLSTGHPWLDEALGGGYPRGELTVCGGATSFGKSSIAILGQEANPDNSIIITLEDSDVRFSLRSLAVKGDVPNIRLTGNTDLSADEVSKLAGVAARQSESPWIYNAQGQTAEQIAKVIAALPEAGINLVFLDYLQRCHPEDEKGNMRSDADKVLRTLADAAKKAGVTLVLYSQYSRQDIQDEPQISWFKESGAIEQYAYVCLLGGFVDKRRDSTGRYLKVEKFKDGEVNGRKFYLQIDRRTGGFVPVEHPPLPEHETYMATNYGYPGKRHH